MDVIINLNFFLALSSFILSFLLTPTAAWLLQKSKVFDEPTSRSAHNRTAIRGIGLAPIVATSATYLLWVASSANQNVDLQTFSKLAVIWLGATALGIVGFIEDSVNLSISVRLILQGGVGLSVGYFLFQPSGHFLLGALIGLMVTPVFVNSHNFMDGIDGISGLQALVSGLALSTVFFLSGLTWLSVVSLVVAFAYLGFLPWNVLKTGWFLGDAGSYFLGGAAAFIVMGGLTNGIIWVALAGPFVGYFSDVGITLIYRFISGKKLGEAHREHAYQYWAEAFNSHIKASLLSAGVTAATSLVAILFLMGQLTVLVTIFLYLFVGVGFALSPRLASAFNKKGNNENPHNRS